MTFQIMNRPLFFIIAGLICLAELLNGDLDVLNEDEAAELLKNALHYEVEFPDVSNSNEQHADLAPSNGTNSTSPTPSSNHTNYTQPSPIPTSYAPPSSHSSSPPPQSTGLPNPTTTTPPFPSSGYTTGTPAAPPTGSSSSSLPHSTGSPHPSAGTHHTGHWSPPPWSASPPTPPPGHCHKPMECHDGSCNYVINIPTSGGCNELKPIVWDTNHNVHQLVNLVLDLTSKVDSLENLVQKIYNDVAPCLKHCNHTAKTTTPSYTTLSTVQTTTPSTTLNVTNSNTTAQASTTQNSTTLANTTPCSITSKAPNNTTLGNTTTPIQSTSLNNGTTLGNTTTPARTTTPTTTSTTTKPVTTTTSTTTTTPTTTPNPCLSFPCNNNGTCSVVNGSAQCICTDDWLGIHCIQRNNCSAKNNPCSIYGNCTDSPNGAQCICKHMFTGQHCQTPICCDPLQCLNPCINGNCSMNSLNDTLNCDCYPGWAGSNCDHDVNECKQSPSPCQCGSTCHNTNGSYYCSCRSGYTGQNCCQDINECDHSPCLAGGTCLNTPGSYQCYCPGDYTGPNCEHHLKCKPTSCGPKTDCFVNSNGVQCVCKRGFYGDPHSRQGCTHTLKSFCGSGDPHYVTYDGQHYNYQGTCPYAWTKVSNTSALQKLPVFEVDAKNMQRWKNAKVSYVEYGVLNVYNYSVSIGRHQQVTVNGVSVTLPHYIPHRTNYKIAITAYGWHGSMIATDFGVSVIFWSNYRLCVFVPYVSGYIGNLCGLGGNMNTDRYDDLKLPNGTVVTTKQESLFGDSWVVTNDTKNCFLGQDVQQHKCSNTVHQQARIQCGVISDPNGAFSQCQSLNMTSRLESNCVYDMCIYDNDPGVLCNALANYATNCQADLPGTILLWRNSTFCPLSCGAHQHYEPCTSSCPNTCSNHTTALTCNQPCYEGCACDNGYVISGTKCVKIENCGCNDKNGNYFQANSSWISGNCSQMFSCQNGTIDHQAISCANNSTCGIEKTIRDCYCNPGFQGNGRSNCTDINECNINGTCGHGNCTNTIGSYSCTCDPNWTGPNCDVFVDHCKDVVCQHGGTCRNVPNNFQCECAHGYFGRYCQIEPQRNCADLYELHGNVFNGVYTIRLPDGNPLPVYCDQQTTDGGGWTVISRRQDGSQEFYRNWTDYESGFGDLRGEFWLGNKYLNILTNDEITMDLRVDLWYCNGDYRYEIYNPFHVSNATSKYGLQLGKASGTAQNGLEYGSGLDQLLNQNGAMFSTFDNDNDQYSKNCAEQYHGGFWYNSCCAANLNGRYYQCGAWFGASDGMFWFPYENDNTPAKHVELKFRPANY